MILCFDFGNTRLKYAIFDGEDWVKFGFLADLSLEKILEIETPEKIHLAVICSVIDIPTHLIDQLHQHYKLKFISKENSHIRFPHYNPNTLGLDRIILAEACHNQFPNQNCLCICLGTCITYNLINASGEFMAGAISPGLTLRAKSMAQFTDQLPLITPIQDFQPWGEDTTSNLQAGIMAGTLFEIKGFVEEAKNNYPNLQVILTGGDANFFTEHYTVDTNLAWKGFLAMV
jgi:type III pantothenate kinase